MGLFDFWKEKKSVPPIDTINEATREGLPKAYIPKFLYKPPFGFPRFVDLPTIRRFAAMPYVEMCITTIVDETSSVPWVIAVKEGIEPTPEHDKQIAHVKSFYDNPNTNKESFDEIRRKYIRDILEVDSGVLIKMFNMKEEMVEIMARDGTTFTKNPDIYGRIVDRDDIIIDPNISQTAKEMRLMEPGWITAADAREKAAYFQYGWITGARPVPFGKKELVWFERNPGTDSIYGRSPVEILMNTIQTLIYAIEHNLEYFSDNSIPKGIIGLDGADSESIKAFKVQWEEQQKTKDSAGNWKKRFHKIPIVGKSPVFTRLQFTNAELELIDSQKWWAKMVWACFGVTATELGYTEDAKGLANQIVQSNIFRKRAINPILRIEEYKHNHEILSEFEYPDIEFKFLMFDVEEETKKAKLYKTQLEAGYRTPNEIRQDEGLDDIEGGDELGKKKNDFWDGNPFEQEKNRKEKESGQQSRTEGKPSEKEEEKKGLVPTNEKDIGTNIETKPFAGYRNFADCVSKNKDKKDPKAYCATIMRKVEGKGYQDNPLILREFEVMTSDRLERSIVYLMKENEKKIIDLIEKEIGKDKLMDIKSVDDVAKRIKDLITFQGLKIISDAVIKNTFVSGWDDAEKQLGQNLMLNKDAITFIQDYTFNNIKGMTEEITQDLRQELERGIMAGEGITKLKDRVSKVFDVGEVRAEAIARTETSRAEGRGRLQAWKASGETDYLKKWVTHFDERTSAICKRLHGQMVEINENFKDKTTGWEDQAEPAHVNCRSTVIYVHKEETPKKSLFKELEKDLAKKEDAEQKIMDKEIDLGIKEKEVDIKNRKKALLKRLEEDHAGDKGISR